MSPIPNAPGVYCILNLLNGKHYIGSSKNLRIRRQSHWRGLRTGTHFNRKLQRSWDKYGESNFRFDVLELTAIENQVEREQYFLDATLPYYNVLRTAHSGKGYKHSSEEIEAAKLRQRKRWDDMTPEQQQEQTERLTIAKRGRKMTAETKHRMSLAKTGVVKSKEWRDNLSKSKGQPYIVISPEGDEFQICGLKRFCDENNLSQGTLSMVLAGKRPHHKGWKLKALN